MQFNLNHTVECPKDAEGMANGVDTDQSAPKGSALFA